MVGPDHSGGDKNNKAQWPFVKCPEKSCHNTQKRAGYLRTGAAEKSLLPDLN